MTSLIKPRERTAIINSLKAGVVPRVGLQHIQVGRKGEIEAVLSDLVNVENGGAAIRFIIGKFGSGKSFFLNLSRTLALEKHFVVTQADITLNHRMQSSGGHARALYSELMHNMSTRAKDDEGGALPALIEQWVADVAFETRKKKENLYEAIYDKLKPFQNLVSGYDFATVIYKYVKGFEEEKETLMSAALRWLQAQYTTKTEARQELGVRSIIDDSNYYDYLKLMAAFSRMAGYKGLLVNIDEMGVISQNLNSELARKANYEMILRILNDCLQGSVSGLGFFFAGTDTFMDDNKRGLASYKALASRLAGNSFAVGGLKDYSTPVIRLPNLTQEEMYVLLRNIRHVYASGDPDKYIIPDEALRLYMQYCAKRLGNDYFQTPRDSVKGFVGFLAVLEQNKEADWRKLLDDNKLEHTADPANNGADPQSSEKLDELAKFQL